MLAKVNVKIGQSSYQFELNEGTEMEILNKIITLGNPPMHCHECDNKSPLNFQLVTNKDKEGNIYINVECLDCTAKAKLGQYKTKGYFWHRFEKYIKKEE